MVQRIHPEEPKCEGEHIISFFFPLPVLLVLLTHALSKPSRPLGALADMVD